MSSSKRLQSLIKIFGMTNQIITEDLTRVEKRYDINLGHSEKINLAEKQKYYSQFDSELRKEASEMGNHYAIFYCLEKSIRELISDTMLAAEGELWWDTKRVPQNIYLEVEKRIKKEKDSGMTVRSTACLDFTTFGELSGIITSNWDLFGGILASQKAVERVMSQLNSLRGPIAHCSPLAEDEVLRLQITLRDWFRQME